MDSGATTIADDSGSERTGVACFGSGRVAYPLVELITRDTLTPLTLVSDDAAQLALFADRIGRLNRANLTTHTMTVTDSKASLAAVTSFLQQASFACVVALVPEDAQYTIARACVATKTPLVTASYVSPRIRQLDQAAKDAGIPLLCECGLDPGIDHMGAMSMIDSIKATTVGTIRRFSSVCGGLPAPEAADNPIGYKFTWSPLGALRALQRPAQYKDNGRLISIPGPEMLSHAVAVRTIPALALEQLPNGNALPYAALYGIPDVPSIFRGTFRYQGFSAIMRDCVTLGLLDDKPQKELFHGVTTWAALATPQTSPETVAFLTWLGDMPARERATSSSPLLAFAAILEATLVLQPDERDLVVLTHRVDVDLPDGSTDVHSATLLGYGDKDATFMARSVGLAAGIAVQLVAAGSVVRSGILAPTTADIYKPALAALATEGIVFVEKVQRIATATTAKL
ncbi:Aste57867_7973 [Aphanomyces stellatus]|uniref:Aste57867_7973 protein n=1 Tax=Aphanomyces stellatus TaxID=120398 RepID=A0A485KJ34_9STRA|nr:hypothetical protein As57867_007943 [Aphanomyces stellatus]VFT84866.1 Aste57867_7973 [Aphanomyces stellatus]